MQEYLQNEQLKSPSNMQVDRIFYDAPMTSGNAPIPNHSIVSPQHKTKASGAKAMVAQSLQDDWRKKTTSVEPPSTNKLDMK